MKTAILSLLIAIAVAGFSFYQFQYQKQETSDFKQSLANLSDNVNKLESNAGQTKTTVNELLNKYQSLTLEDDWKIAEISHFLRLAGIELEISRDVPTTIRLMDAADNLIGSMPNPKYLAIREQIAKEKLSLQAVKLPDIEKIWFQVGALMDQISKLPTRGSLVGSLGVKAEQDLLHQSNSKLNASMKTDSNVNANTNTNGFDIKLVATNNSANGMQVENAENVGNVGTTKTADWEKGLQSSWRELKDLIKIQRHTEPIEPILKEPEQALARENLLLLFEQIRWAILHGNNAVYQRSISEAKQWLNNYFEMNDSHVQQIQASLDELAKIDLHPALPKIGQALKALQNKG